jgi:hypothetical protein
MEIIFDIDKRFTACSPKRRISGIWRAGGVFWFGLFNFRQESRARLSN